MIIRPTKLDDLPGLEDVLEDTGLFPSEMLRGLVTDSLATAGIDIWLTCEVDGLAVGFCYAVPEKLTDGTWNMLAIAVRSSVQGGGHGSALTRELEHRLGRNGHRLLIADTSGKAEFEATRNFYRKNGFVEEARIRDFWAAGDDKVVFLKKLN